MPAASPKSLDDLDRKLIAALQLRGRASWKEISAAIGVAESTVVRRGRHLFESGSIRVVGFVDVLRAGLGVPMLVRIRTRPGEVTSISHAVQSAREVRYSTVLAGSVDIVAEYVVPSHRAIGNVLNLELAQQDRELSTETLAVMRTFHSTRAWEDVLDDRALAMLRPEGSQPQLERYWTDPLDLDDLDLALLTALGDNARASMKQLAALAGTSESTAGRRVDRLVAEGALYFRAVVPPALLGVGVELLIWMSVESGALGRVSDMLIDHPATRYLWVTTGRFNLCAGVHLPHFGSLYRYETEVLGGLPGVRDSEITPHLRTLKRAWISLDEDGRPTTDDGSSDSVRDLQAARRLA